MYLLFKYKAAINYQCTSIFFLLSVKICYYLFQLLQKEKENRLGAKRDFQEIRNHSFFAEINWDDLDAKKINPPYNPNVVSAIHVHVLILKKLIEIIIFEC